MFPKYPRLPVIVCSGYDPNGQPSNSGLDFKFDSGKSEGEDISPSNYSRFSE
jgi:hypothetical protein